MFCYCFCCMFGLRVYGFWAPEASEKYNIYITCLVCVASTAWSLWTPHLPSNSGEGEGEQATWSTSRMLGTTSTARLRTRCSRTTAYGVVSNYHTGLMCNRTLRIGPNLAKSRLYALSSGQGARLSHPLSSRGRQGAKLSPPLSRIG